MQSGATAEQPLAAAGFEQQPVGLQHHVRRELVGPAGEFGERGLFAFGIAFERDQLACQRLGGGDLHARRHTGRLRRCIAVDHGQTLRRAFDDRQRPHAGQCALGQLQRQRGQDEGEPQGHGAARAGARRSSGEWHQASAIEPVLSGQ